MNVVQKTTNINHTHTRMKPCKTLALTRSDIRVQFADVADDLHRIWGHVESEESYSNEVLSWAEDAG